jgi:hypothetical protein
MNIICLHLHRVQIKLIVVYTLTHNTSLNLVVFAGSLVFSVKSEGLENQHPLCVKSAQVSHKNYIMQLAFC